MIRFFFLLVTITLFLPMMPARAETITLVADVWCPYNCEPGSDHPGYMVELAQKAFAKHNIQVAYKTMPWARAIEDTRQNKYTAIIGAYYSDAPDFIYPKDPQGICDMMFYVRKDSDWQYAGISSLQGKSLGVINDYSYNKEVDAYIEKNRSNPAIIQMVSGDNAIGTNIKKLMLGRVDIIAEARPVLQYHLSKPGHEEEKSQIKEAGLLPSEEDDNGAIFIAFSPQNSNAKKYADILSSETQSMRESGELADIMKRYGVEETAH